MMHSRSKEIVDSETVSDAAEVNHPLDRYRKLNIVIGALVFGYYNGYILSRLYIQDDIRSILQEIIRTGVLGAVFGSSIGGWTNDFLGRRFALFVADGLIFIGGVLLMLLLSISDSDSECCLITVGKTFMGLGVGMASMTSPIYIVEVSSTYLQGNLVDYNCVLFAVGKCIFFCADSTVTSYSQDLNKTSDYILAVAGLPALLQFVLMLSLPDSPIWLYKRNRQDDAVKALRKIYSSCEVEKEFDALRLSIKNETAGQDEKGYSGGRNIWSRIKTTWNNPLERRQIVVGIGLQVAEHLVSGNMIIYIFPHIMSMGGIIASPHPKWDIRYMKFSFLFFYGLFGIHGACLPYFTIKLGRRKNLLVKSYRMIVGLLGLSFIFIISPNNIERVSRLETITHFGDNACLSFISAADADTWDCLTCLRAECGFCAGIGGTPMRAPGGACLTIEPNGTSQSCLAEHRTWLTRDSVRGLCRINLIGIASLYMVLVCLTPYAFGLEWYMYSRMYMAEVRGIFVGTVAATNWIFFLVVIVSSSYLKKRGGYLFSMLLISLISFAVIRLVKLSYLFVPENKGSFQTKEDKTKVS